MCPKDGVDQDIFRKSIVLKADWNSYRGLGWALLEVKQIKNAINTFRNSIAMKENRDSYRGLAKAFKKKANPIGLLKNSDARLI